MGYLSILGGFGLLMLVACNGSPSNAEADTAEARIVDSSAQRGTSLKVDTAESKISWKGSKLIGSGHAGIVPIISGTLQLSKGQITGGSFLIDMKDVQPLDQDSASNAKLKAHLSSSDFFAVDSFPTASFEVTQVSAKADTAGTGTRGTNSTITGNLTIKAVTKSISFPAKVTEDEQGAIIASSFTIDRTKWGINYGSENSIKDKIIRKEIEFTVNVKVKK